MTKYKKGDWLRGTASLSGLPNDEVYEGEFRGEYDDWHGDWPRVHGSDGDSWYLDPAEPIEVIKPQLSFIGPKPERVEEPTVTTPFRSAGAFIYDASDNYMGKISGFATTGAQDRALAELVRDLLNKHFGA
ncbi:hypothetical protein ACFWY9_28690 [Amycolatopsis sp. NPDC059027]|uniref:hypothetical protein n=1 Tax=Amycolatopsis sp. NPDC059027 TaxID=3346709 RepID=UPI00366CC3B0